MNILKKMSNDELSALILVGIVLAMGLTVLPPVTELLSLLVVTLIPIVLANTVAKTIDWLDDNIEAELEMSPLYHLVYAVGIGLLLGTLLAPIWLRLSPAVFEVLGMSPRALYFLLNVALALVGYGIAWRNIPNHKEV